MYNLTTSNEKGANIVTVAKKYVLFTIISKFSLTFASFFDSLYRETLILAS